MDLSSGIAIAGIALTFAASVANLIYSWRTSRRTTFVNTVTASRLKWIDSLRDKVSEYIAVTTQIAAQSSGSTASTELLLQRDTLLHQIVLHLNPKDTEDQRIKHLVERTQISVGSLDKKELPAMLTELRNAAGSYLKKEWNRVKEESEGKARLG
jgi:hypothetical protein